MRLKPQGLAQILVDHDQLDLHFIGQDVLDVHAHGLPGAQCGVRLRQPRQVRCDLNKDAVFLDAAHNSDDGLPGGKAGCVLAPGTQQLAQRQHNAPLHVAVLDGTQKLLADLHPVRGRGDAADRQAVDGQQRRNAAADVAERAEILNVGHGAGDDAAGLQCVKVLCPAAALCLGAGEQVVFLAVIVKLGAHDDKAGRAAHPGQHGNVLDGLAGCGVHTVRKRHDAAQPAQLKPQAVPCVVGQGGALQHLAAGHAAAQLLAAQVVRIAAKAFGSIFQHFRFLISYKICDGFVITY